MKRGAGWRGILNAYRFLIVILAIDFIILALWPATGRAVFRHTWATFAEMLAILPPVFLLLGLLDVWVPREAVMKVMGEKSKVLGAALSVVLGAAAAGPLYGAFPVAETMHRKGVRYFNIIVFLGAWSTLKIPMALFEMASLGPRFALLRWAINVPAIILIALIIDRLIPQSEKVVSACRR